MFLKKSASNSKAAQTWKAEWTVIRRDAVVRTLKDHDVSTVAEPTDARAVGAIAKLPVAYISIDINAASQKGVSVTSGAHGSAR